MNSRILEFRKVIEQALKEDSVRHDVTTRLLFKETIKAEGIIRANEETIIAGLPFAQLCFRLVDSKIRFHSIVQDGNPVKSGTVVAHVRGDGRSLLKAERVALNFLQHLSGIATLTGRFVEALRGTKTQILDTRKTTPGLRALEKYAVRMGGAHNHRMDLSDGILIKDNHLALAGSLKVAVAAAKRGAPPGSTITVETKSLTQVGEAISAQADRILLDNMTVPMIKEALILIGGKALTEASGGVNLSNVREIAAAGVDYISIGALTHSAPAVDVSFDIAPLKRHS